MTPTDIRKKLVDYLKVADEKKVQAIYTMLEDEINTEANEWDDDFKMELERRNKNYRSGATNTFTWEETKKAAVENAKAKRK